MAAQVTFKVDEVAISRASLDHSLTPKQAIELQTNRRVEACSSYVGRLVSGCYSRHALFAAAHLAFSKHRPLVLSPDAIWLTIAMGFATHVQKNARKLRQRFVSHEGKLLLKVVRNDFVRGSPENPWPGVFAEFSGKIREHIGDTRHDQLVPTFSTTGPIERAASEVVLIATMQSYFDLRLITRCGIPEVTLLGTVEDWKLLESKVAALAEFDLAWWTEPLARVTAEFVKAAKGQPTTDWCKWIYKEVKESGGPRVTGWLAWLVPYLERRTYSAGAESTELVRSHHLGKLPELTQNPFVGRRGNLVHSDLPSALSSVSFTWEYMYQPFKYEFLAGLVGVREDAESLALEPVIGWAVRPKDAPPVDD